MEEVKLVLLERNLKNNMLKLEELKKEYEEAVELIERDNEFIISEMRKLSV